MQKEEWSSADKTLKVHKSKLELAKEQAAAARSTVTLPPLHCTCPLIAVLLGYLHYDGVQPYNVGSYGHADRITMTPDRQRCFASRWAMSPCLYCQHNECVMVDTNMNGVMSMQPAA